MSVEIKTASQDEGQYIRIIRHSAVSDKLQISSSKLYHMIQVGQCPRPFSILPGGRIVGWIEVDVDQWILDRRDSERSKIS